MISNYVSKCPKCKGMLKYYDSVNRILRTKRGITSYIKIKRFMCCVCGSVHRLIPPETLFPYKHYEVEVIRGVVEGWITSDTLDYEDYPCEATMNIWRQQFGNKLV